MKSGATATTMLSHVLLSLPCALAYDSARCADFVAAGHCTVAESADYMARFCAGSCSGASPSVPAAARTAQTEVGGTQAAAPPVAGATCEPFCEDVPCTELNGNIDYECGACMGAQYRCRPGTPGFPGRQAPPPPPPEPTPPADDTPTRVSVGNSGSVALAVDVDDTVPDGLSCTPHVRTLGEGPSALRVCPILNGIWTSFLDHRQWGEYNQPLDAPVAARIAAEMRAYDQVGLSTWIGEDFDERVLSALASHHELFGDAPADAPAYSIIIEAGHRVDDNLKALSARLGVGSTLWAQLGPPALDHLPSYRVAKVRKQVAHFGVEDYDAPMLARAAKVLKISTVQQEINAIVRPADATVSFCVEHGCRFIAYGPLLGGLLSDRYLGVGRPTPDKDHTKQLDYLDSIDAWADWRTFQLVLQAMRAVGDKHDGASISTVALAYVLQLPHMLAAIVGVRLGHALPAEVGDEARHSATYHRKQSLEALQLQLSADDVASIDQAVARGKVLDGLART